MNNQQQGEREEEVYVNSGGYFPQMPRNDRADFVDKIKPEQIYVSLQHSLVGEEWIDERWVKNPNIGDDCLTEWGAWNITNYIKNNANLNISLSNHNDDFIRRRAVNITNTLLKNINSNHAKYGIKEPTMIPFLSEIILSNVTAVLYHSLNAGFQELLKGTVQENRMVQSEVKKPGIIKRILGFGS